MAKNIPKCLIIESRKQTLQMKLSFKIGNLVGKWDFFVNFMHSDMCRLEARAEESFDEWHKD